MHIPEKAFSALTDEQKRRVEAARTPEELLAIAKESGYELTTEELNKVSQMPEKGKFVMVKPLCRCRVSSRLRDGRSRQRTGQAGPCPVDSPVRDFLHAGAG